MQEWKQQQLHRSGCYLTTFVHLPAEQSERQWMHPQLSSLPGVLDTNPIHFIRSVLKSKKSWGWHQNKDISCDHKVYRRRHGIVWSNCMLYLYKLGWYTSHCACSGHCAGATDMSPLQTDHNYSHRSQNSQPHQHKEVGKDFFPLSMKKCAFFIVFLMLL